MEDLIRKVKAKLKDKEDCKCEKHPNYTGKKIPTNECVECLNVYNKLHHSPRVLPMPTKIIKDKSKYNRKNKFKINFFDE